MRNSGRKEEMFNDSRSKGIFNINSNDKMKRCKENVASDLEMKRMKEYHRRIRICRVLSKLQKLLSSRSFIPKTKPKRSQEIFRLMDRATFICENTVKARGILKNKRRLIGELVGIFAVKSSSWILKRSTHTLEMKGLTSTDLYDRSKGDKI